jgi:hypothetical protein
LTAATAELEDFGGGAKGEIVDNALGARGIGASLKIIFGAFEDEAETLASSSSLDSPSFVASNPIVAPTRAAAAEAPPPPPLGGTRT